MNKKLSYLLLLIATLLSISLLLKSNSFQEPKNYTEATRHFLPLNLKQVEEKLVHKEEFVLFTGRESCPYCQKFVPKLARAVFNTQTTVYYLDSEKGDIAAITHFSKKHSIKTVPNLSFFKNGEQISYLEKGSHSSLEEIQIFLRQH